MKEADASGTLRFPLREAHSRYIVFIYWLIFIFSLKLVHVYGIFICGAFFSNAFVLYLCGISVSAGHQAHAQPAFCPATQRPFAPASFIYKHPPSPAVPAAQQDIQKTLFVIFWRMNAFFHWHAKSLLAHHLQSPHPPFKALLHAAD